jgi:hypothetical protein
LSQLPSKATFSKEVLPHKRKFDDIVTTISSKNYIPTFTSYRKPSF